MNTVYTVYVSRHTEEDVNISEQNSEIKVRTRGPNRLPYRRDPTVGFNT